MSFFKEIADSVRSNYYSKLLTCFSGTIVVCLIVFILFFTYVFMSNDAATRAASDENAFDRFVTEFEDGVFEQTDSLLTRMSYAITPYTMLTTPNAYNPFDPANDSFETTRPFAEDLYRLHEQLPYVRTVSMYSYDYHTYISSRAGAFFNTDRREATLSSLVPYDLLTRISNASTSQFIFAPRDSKNMDFDNCLVMVKSLPLFSSKENRELTLFISLDVEQMNNTLFRHESLFDSSFWLVNSDGEVLYSLSSTQHPIADEDFARYVTEGGSTLRSNGKTFNVFSQPSSYNGMTYYYASYQPSFLTRLGEATIYILPFLCVIFLIGGLVTTLCSRVLYRPIRSLMRLTDADVPDTKGTAHGINELAMIETHFLNVHDRLTEYEQNLQENAVLLRSNMAGNLLNGSICSVAELNTGLSTLGQTLLHDAFFFFIVNPDPEVFADIGYKERNYILFALIESVQELFPCDDPTHIRVLSQIGMDNQITFIVNIPSDGYEEGRAMLSQVLSRLNTEFGQIFNIACSECITDLTEFPSRHKTVRGYFRYGFLYGNGNIFTRQLVQEYDANPGIYDSAFLKNIRSLLRAGSFEELKLELQEFRRQIYNKGYSFLYAQTVTMQILGVFVDEFHDNDLPLPQIDGADFLSAFSRQQSSIDTCFHFYEQAIDLFAQSLNDRASRIDSDFMRSIIDYIHENVATVSLSSLSDTFKISSGHLSRMFKKNMGMNFSEYLLGVKLEKACILLVETNLKISDIAEQLGYFNINYFNRIFKAQLGMTPTQYRKSKS